MRKPKPGILAVRAVNQYRRRDVLGYLGLRYYLDNVSARSNEWIKEVAIDLVIHRSQGSYFKVQHFKDIQSSKTVGHREMFVPGPNEALVEALLIDQCNNLGGKFKSSENVFSYIPAEAGESSGVFGHYMHGLKKRQKFISDVCREQPECMVQFLDIKSFYPSISLNTAQNVWQNACTKSNMDKKLFKLGQKLLDDYKEPQNAKKPGLLTGPMFSHLIANLKLSDIDTELSTGPAQYCRYVDDIVLIGSGEQIKKSLVVVQQRLEELGLQLHDENSPKRLEVNSKEWLESENDFSDRNTNPSWKSLIGDLKKLLLWNSDITEELKSNFKNEGLRIPVPDYSGVVKEANFVRRISELAKKTWFMKVTGKISPKQLIEQALSLKKSYDDELQILIKELDKSNGFLTKRILPKIRYRMGRLLYLAEPSRLIELSNKISEFPDLHFQSQVGLAVGTGNIDKIITLGTNAAQATAQPLRMASHKVLFSRPSNSILDMQSLAVFAFNGVPVEMKHALEKNSEIYDFASNGSTKQLMKSPNQFMSEIACLHGLHERPRHPDLLDSAFDIAEDIALDAIEQNRPSFSF